MPGTTSSMTTLPTYSDGIVEKVVNDLHQQLHLETFNCFVELRHHIPYIAKTCSWIFQESVTNATTSVEMHIRHGFRKGLLAYSSLLLFSFFFSGRSGKGVSWTNRIFFFFAADLLYILIVVSLARLHAIAWRSIVLSLSEVGFMKQTKDMNYTISTTAKIDKSLWVKICYDWHRRF